jgi:hypothetical protein
VSQEKTVTKFIDQTTFSGECLAQFIYSELYIPAANPGNHQAPMKILPLTLAQSTPTDNCGGLSPLGNP